LGIGTHTKQIQLYLICTIEVIMNMKTGQKKQTLCVCHRAKTFGNHLRIKSSKVRYSCSSVSQYRWNTKWLSACLTSNTTEKQIAKTNLVMHANLKYLPEIFVIETSQNLPRNPIKIIWIDQSIRAFHTINPVYLSQPLHGIFFNKQLKSRAKETITH
jgi:hypothetical protein